MRRKPLPCLLMAPSRGRPPVVHSPRNQSQITGHLLTTWKTRNVPQCQRKSQRCDRSHPRLGHQQPRHFALPGCFFRRLVQHRDLLVEDGHEPQQVLPSLPRPVRQGQLAQQLLPCLAPQPRLLLYTLIQGQVLQLVLRPNPQPYQPPAMDQQLSLLPLFNRGRPDFGKVVLQQQIQDVRCITPVGLLLAYLFGPNRGRVSDQYLMAHASCQVHKPVTVARCFHPHQRRLLQLTIKSLGFSVPMHQLPFSGFSRLCVHPRDLLPVGMVITPYNHHERLLSSQWFFFSSNQEYCVGRSLSSYPINSSLVLA